MARPRSIVILGTVGLTAALLVGPGTAHAVAPRVTLTLPDLQVLVPTNAISIGTNPSSGDRQLQFTHVTWDAGKGPFAIQPAYDAATGRSSFAQVLYDMPSTGRWSVVERIPLAVDGIFEPPSDYRYPLTRFTLNRVASDGGVGSLVATSPKVDYCITGDTYVGGVPNTPSQTSPPQSDCADASKLLGFSVGWGDQYDQTDNGQPIDLTGIADGTYWLQATVDPQHLFAESNRNNDVVDTKLQISGSNVTVLTQTRPNVVPPSVALTAPANGASVKGSVTLEATASAPAPASVSWVQFLLDGVPLGPHLSAPYHYSWSTGPLPGTHTLAAQVEDTDGMLATSAVRVVHVVRSHVPGLAIDATATGEGHGTVRSGLLTTSVANDTIVAFAALDGPAAAAQRTTVSGLGLTWHLVRRSDGQAGDAEIWTAHATKLVTRRRVTSTPSSGGFAQQLVVDAFSGAEGLGASARSSARSGAPSVSLKTLGKGSMVLAVGSDWDQTIPRTPRSGQVVLNQWLDTGDGDTFWVQSISGVVAQPGTVTIVDTQPTTDRYDLAAVEVRAAPLPPASAVIVAPARGQVVSAVTPVDVALRDPVPVRSVVLEAAGRRIGTARVGADGAVLRWRTAAWRNGAYRLVAIVRDARGRTMIVRSVVDVANPRPPMTCFVLQTDASSRGATLVTTAAVHVAARGEQLLAVVRATPGTVLRGVTGPGLTWRRIASSRSRAGVVAVFAATSPRAGMVVRVSSRAHGGDQTLTVLALEGTDGFGATMSASGAGSRQLGLRTVHGVSLVVLAGTGRAPAARGWVRLDVAPGSFVEYTNQPVMHPGTRVALPLGTARGAWSVLAVELPGDGG